MSSYVATHHVYRSDITATKGEVLTDARTTEGRAGYNDDKATKREAAFSVLYPDEVRDLDFLVMEMTITDDQGRVETVPLGHYVVMGRDGRMDNRSKTGTLHGRDLTWLLHIEGFDGLYVVPAGTDTGAAARTILMQQGIPPELINIPDSGVLTTVDLPSMPDDTILSYLTDLLAGGAMYQPYVAADSRITSRKARDIASATPDRSYHTADGAKIVPPVIEPLSDLSRLYNQVTVQKVMPGAESIAWTATVTDLSSPVHPDVLRERLNPRRNRPVILPRVFDEFAIASRDEAQALAEARLSEGASQYQRVTVTTYPDPTTLDGHQIFDLNLVFPGDGQSYYTGTWHQRAWDITARNGRMTVERELFRTVAWR